MTDITSFSEAGLRAIPDPMADIFKHANARAAAYTQATGKEFISLAAGAPDPAILPAELYLQLAGEVLGADYAGRNLLNYTMPHGIPALRTTLERVLTTQGVVCSAQEMLITSGGMEALSLGTWMTLNAGDTVITEGPGFAGALSMFELYGAKIVQLPGDENGITPELLEAAIVEHKPTLLCLMPDNQNPSGAVMPLENRKAIAALLQKYDVYALEDGAYSQLRLEGDALPPLQSFSPNNVLYATSVSKIFAPAMRIGVLVAPQAFVDKAGDIKSAYNMQASAIEQAIAERFLNEDNGHLEAHLPMLCDTYRARRDAMVAALEKYFPTDAGFTWNVPKGGMFLWLSGPETVNFTDLFDVALENGVAYVPGSKFYAGANPPHNAARLNYASTPAEKIDEPIRRLAITVGVTK